MVHPSTSSDRLIQLATALLLLLVCCPADAQPVRLKSAGLESGWYAPDLSFYSTSDDFLLNFEGAPSFGADVEVEVFRHLTLRGGVGYWSQSDVVEVATDDPENARRHAGKLYVVPLSLTLYHEASWLSLAGVRPVFGGGFSQNLVQRSFERVRVDGSTPAELFDGNGRGYTYHIMSGLHRQLIAPIWIAVEARYVTGAFEEESGAGDANRSVSLDGWRYVASLRYRIR